MGSSSSFAPSSSVTRSRPDGRNDASSRRRSRDQPQSSEPTGTLPLARRVADGKPRIVGISPCERSNDSTRFRSSGSECAFPFENPRLKSRDPQLRAPWNMAERVLHQLPCTAPEQPTLLLSPDETACKPQDRAGGRESRIMSAKKPLAQPPLKDLACAAGFEYGFRVDAPKDASAASAIRKRDCRHRVRSLDFAQAHEHEETNNGSHCLLSAEPLARWPSRPHRRCREVSRRRRAFRPRRSSRSSIEAEKTDRRAA